MKQGSGKGTTSAWQSVFALDSEVASGVAAQNRPRCPQQPTSQKRHGHIVMDSRAILMTHMGSPSYEVFIESRSFGLTIHNDRSSHTEVPRAEAGGLHLLGDTETPCCKDTTRLSVRFPSLATPCSSLRVGRFRRV